MPSMHGYFCFRHLLFVYSLMLLHLKGIIPLIYHAFFDLVLKISYLTLQ